MIDVADDCEEWLNKDFQKVFTSYAKLSACLPGDLMENIVCMSRWLLNGKVVGAVNTAEMMVKLLTLSGTCLHDTQWPFTKADVLYNYAKLALHWQDADVGCRAVNRFGQPLQGDCPDSLTEATLKRLLWVRSPLQQQGGQKGGGGILIRGHPS